MTEAGIENPESQKGKDFCTKKCPYPKCILFESGGQGGAASLRKETRITKTKAMKAEGYQNPDIAQILKVSVRTIERYLEK